ncbi:MAG: antitoxin VapB family protein [Candidatus Thermoplasmatota archaeon]
MTKTLSLADDAYEALTRVKRSEESFSDLARRLARLAAQEHVFQRSDEPPVWTDTEAEALKRTMYRARDDSRKPRVRRRPKAEDTDAPRRVGRSA